MKFNLDHLLYKFNGLGKPDPEIVHNQSIRSREFKLSPKKFIVIFVVAVLIIGVISVVTLLKEREEAETDGDVSQEVTGLTSAEITDTHSLNTSFLFGFSSTSSSGLKFLAVASVDSENNAFSFKYIPVDSVSSVDGTTVTLQSHFSQGGISRIQAALISRFQVACSRYVFTNESNLAEIFGKIGEVDITLEKNINYNYEGIQLIFEKGTRTFNQDMMVKYFSYLSDNIEKNEKEMMEFLRIICSRIFSLDNGEHFYDIYTAVVNNLSSDISLSDIQLYGPVINKLYLGGTVGSVNIERFY